MLTVYDCLWILPGCCVTVLYTKLLERSGIFSVINGCLLKLNMVKDTHTDSLDWTDSTASPVEYADSRNSRVLTMTLIW